MSKRIACLFALMQLFYVTILEAQTNFFSNKNEAAIEANSKMRVIVPSIYRAVELDINELKNYLSTIPKFDFNKGYKQCAQLLIPMPDGSNASFFVWERTIMEPALAAEFPSIKTYIGQGLTDATATISFDITEFGFHAMILSPVSGDVFIDNYFQQNSSYYISYFKKDYKNFPSHIDFNGTAKGSGASNNALPAGLCVGSSLRKYRLAVGCSNQYAQAATGLASPTKTQAMSKIITTVNRVVGVYEKELDITMVLIANNANIVYVTSAGDPFAPYNNNPNGLITQSQTTITNVIGSANFDIGHTFCNGDAGFAYEGVVCDNQFKASGITGRPNPVGDPFDIDYVAHEMGHQFGASHTFTGNTDYCTSNTSTLTNCEPGSGSTIMAYAGICGVNNLQANSDAQFHAASLAQISTYTITGVGNGCAVTTATGNTAPVVNAGADYTIPPSTPFILDGSATDANADALTYSWEQTNTGAAEDMWNGTEDVNTPIFRSYSPKTVTYRLCPKDSNVVNGTTTIGERMSTINRTLNFRLTARDNRAGGGGVCYDDMVVNVSTASVPFTVTYPNTTTATWLNGEIKTITWNKGTTDVAPFNVAYVAIELSTDGGYTFPVTLLSNTPNDGSENITVPKNYTTKARIRIRAIGNIFYAISKTNYTIDVNPVPVKWQKFTAEKLDNSSVKLNWQVNELNNHHYEIERSNSGDIFYKLNTVTAASNGINNYSFIDEKPFYGKSYYRIKQVDVDGRYSYSSIVVVVINQTKNNWVIYPNPATDKLNITCNNSYSKLLVEVFDASGRQLLQQPQQNILIGETVSINLSSLAKGVYSVKLTAATGETEVKKIFVQ